MNHPEDITTTFWNNIKTLLKAKSMNIYSLSLACGLSKRSLERSYQRNAVPDGYNTFLMAKALGVTVEDLFSEKEVIPKNSIESMITNLTDQERGVLEALLGCYLLKK